MVFEDYQFVKMRVGVVSAAITRLVQWKDYKRLLRATRCPHDAHLPNTVGSVLPP
jgi:hypothetical protein